MKNIFKNYNFNEAKLAAELSEFMANLEGGHTLTSYLLMLMDKKGLTAPEVYHRADLQRQGYNKLIQPLTPRRAKKQTLMQICIGIEATEEEAKDILATCGFMFEPDNHTDMAFLFCISKGTYKMEAVDAAQYVLDNHPDIRPGGSKGTAH